jgi:hypothetical protein
MGGGVDKWIFKWIFGLAVVASGGCRSSSPATGIVAEVTTDLRVPEDLAEIEVAATMPDGTPLYAQTFPLAGGGGVQTYALPLRVGLHPQGSATAAFRIEATALLGASRVVSRSAVLSFEEGRVILLPLPLLSACANVTCTQAGTTCAPSGACVPEAVDPSQLPTYKPGSDAGAGGGGDASDGGVPPADGADRPSAAGDARDAAGDSSAADAGRDLAGAADAAPDAAVMLDQGLVAWWSFDQSGTSYPDNSGNGNTGVMSGLLAGQTLWTASGFAGGALDLTPNDVVMTTSPSTSSKSITGAVTYAAFVKAPAAGSIHTLVSHGLDVGGELDLGFADTGALRFVIAGRTIQTNTPVNGDGTQWMHVAATYDGRVAVLYVAGAPVLTTTIGAMSFASTYFGFIVGGTYDDINALYVEDFNGQVDELTIYNRALGAAEISALARGAFPTRR